MTDRNLLITGASRGIGAATARMAAHQGWNVAINYHRDQASAEAVAAEVRAAGRRALVVQADVADAAQIEALFAAVDTGLGPLHALVNNAGVVDVAARVEGMSAQRLQRMWATNLSGSVLCAREAVRRMSTRHGGAGGSIVNLSSAAARVGSPGLYLDYSMSKAAIDHFTTGLAREVAGEGIRVNAVRPGIIATDIHATSGHAERVAASVSLIPMARLGTAGEVAESIVWLLSDAAAYVTGALLDVAGGR
ncbi:MAG: SDR family oxidoreductase [Vitreoscilla sp.]|jgi:NAD(P)-dependent dehydrogenase (short-subunit alcohol dehydrogenase family)|nr:SDR family oxidoreductase [Vitreoscilla sp.]